MSENWKTYSFGELYNVASGLSKSRDQFGFGSPFVTFKNVFYNYFLPSELGELANTNQREQNSGSVKKGDIFLTRTSETLHELGMSSVALKDYPEATFNGFCKRLRLKENLEIKVDPVFIGYYLRSAYFRTEVTKFATMTTRASLNTASINSLTVSLPTIDEQIHIGEILKPIDDKIELNLQMNKTLEEMAMTLYKHWFVDFGPFKDREFYDVKLFGNNTLVQIPTNFETYSIRDSIIRLKPNNKYDQTNVLTQGKVRVFDQSNSRILGYHNNIPDFISDFENPTLVFGDHTCLMEIVCEDFSVGPNLIPFRSKEQENIYVMYLGFKDKVYINDYKRHWSELMLHQIALPKDKNVILDFNSKIKENFSLITKNEFENQTLTTLRDTLLPKLISGEVRVKEAEKILEETF
jgi:type I restriction enzyme S subunit